MSNIRNLSITERNSDFFKIELEIDVIDLEHLSKVIVSLRTSDFIETVTRIWFKKWWKKSLEYSNFRNIS